MLPIPIQISCSQLFKDINERVRRKLKKSRMPMMRQKEIDIVEQILYRLQPKRCLEWGSGFSTLHFPQLLSQNAQWLALEHDRSWSEKVITLNQKDNVKIKAIYPNEPQWTGDGAYEDFRDYIEYPSDQKYDFILVDGRARTECLQKSRELLSEKGVVLLHDANRKMYQNELREFKNSLLFSDHNKNGGLWIGSMEQDIERILDVELHRKVWKVHENMSKYLLIR